MEAAVKAVMIDPEDIGAYESLLIPEVQKELEARSSAVILGVEQGETALGTLAGFLEQDDEGKYYFLLSWLFVAPDYRNMGLGSMLFEALVTLLKDGAEQARYIVCAFTTEDEETEQLYTFLSEEGMEDLDPDSEQGELEQEMILVL